MTREALLYRVITYASDHFPGMIDIARKMIQAGHMYADDTDVDTMRTERMACTPSKNRDQKPEETLKIFDDEMLKGTAVRPTPLNVVFTSVCQHLDNVHKGDSRRSSFSDQTGVKLHSCNA